MISRLFSKKKSGNESSRPADTFRAKTPQEPPKDVLRVSSDAFRAEEAAKQVVDKAAKGSMANVPVLPKNSDVRTVAAAMFASGNTREAIEHLINHLNVNAGKCEKNIWYMLFDAYQVLDQQSAFEKLSRFFSQHFHTSAPSWEDLAQQKQTGLGRNALVIDGAPSGVQQNKQKDFVWGVKEAGTGRLDLSRAVLESSFQSRRTSLEILLYLMQRIRRYRARILLMGETTIVEELRRLLQEEEQAQTDEVHWEVLMEFLQWRGQEESFEALADQYMIRFERSPPGYEIDGVIAILPDSNHHVQKTGEHDGISVPMTIDEVAAQTLIADIQKHMNHAVNLRIDFSKVKRMTYDGALTLVHWMQQAQMSRENIVVVNPTELLLALFDLTGLSSFITVVPKKR